jgi:hypothetical protein
MTIVQFGLSWLGQKTEKPKDLIKSLVVIQSDAKKNDISQKIIIEFIKAVHHTTTSIPDPRILISLWAKYKHIGTLTK